MTNQRPSLESFAGQNAWPKACGNCLTTSFTEKNRGSPLHFPRSRLLGILYDMTVESLASFQRISQQIIETWPAFLSKRQARLFQQERHGAASEKVAENILEDLFTEVLDWKIADLNNQIEFADIVLTSLGIKKLVVEVKRPGALRWNKRSFDDALDQAQRYADAQKVKSIAVSDGTILYARDLIPGGFRDRVLVDLSATLAPIELWWLCIDGLYRDVEELPNSTPLVLQTSTEDTEPAGAEPRGILLHPKYKLPARCFAYVGNSNNPRTWFLPYLCDDGTPDLSRLPKAIQAILSNYRGARVSNIPEEAIPEVLETLAKTAMRIGKLPAIAASSAKTYLLLQEALEQQGRWPLASN